MSLSLISEPSNAPVTLAEVKGLLRIDHEDEDAFIGQCIAAAVSRFDGPSGVLGKALITQTWELSFQRFTEQVALPLSPCQSVTSVSYLDPFGNEQTLSTDDYAVLATGTVGGAYVVPAYGKCWPETLNFPESIGIEFVAGFGDDPEDVPDDIRQAIMMHGAHLFEHREAVTMGTGHMIEVPQAVAEIIDRRREFSF